MTEPDDREVRQALRAMLSDRIGTLTPPNVYDSVRRRARRRRRVTVGGALVVALAAVAVPSFALADRRAAPSAADRPAERRCEFDGAVPEPVPDVRLPAQRDVRGSLGGNAELVSTVLRVGWATLYADARGAPLDPSTARVEMVQRVEGQIVGMISASGPDRRSLRDWWVWGPDAEHLVGFPVVGAAPAVPRRTPYATGDAVVHQATICGLPYVLVATAPGATGRASWISGISPQLRPVRSTLTVPMRADGIAAFRVDAYKPRVRLERAGRVLFDGPATTSDGDPFGPTEDELDRVAAEAPGDGDPDLVRSIVEMQLGAAGLPVPQSDRRVLWAGRAGAATVAISACTLPGGVAFVTGGTTATAGSLDRPYYSGLLAPGALERTVLAWRIGRPGEPVVAFAVGGVRAEAVLANGDVRRFALSGGGGVLESGATVRRVRVYGAGDRLIGEQVPGQGLVEVPSETPV